MLGKYAKKNVGAARSWLCKFETQSQQYNFYLF